MKTSALRLQNWLNQILQGLQYLHTNGIVHRDIKGPNILLSSKNFDTCTLKIGDLGDVKRLLSDATQYREVSHDKGTFAFMSPEMVAGNTSNIGRKTDIWSLGCLVIEMLTAAHPKFIKTGSTGEKISLTGEAAVLYYIGNGGCPEIPENLPAEIHDFILKCIQRDPAARPKVTELLQHPFLTSPNAEFWMYPDHRPLRLG